MSVTYIYDHIPCDPHSYLVLMPLATYLSDIIKYTVIIHSGENPTTALLPERGRRPPSFTKINTQRLPSGIVRSSTERPTPHLQR